MSLKSGNRDHCSPFSVFFQTIGKFAIVFVRLTFGKVWVDAVTGQRREIDVRYELNLQVNLKGLGWK